MSFSDEVDAALQGMRVTLGTGDPPKPSEPKQPNAAPTWPAWTGVLSDAAHHASDNLDRSRTQIYFDQVAAVSIIKHAGDIAAGARTKLSDVEAGWQHDKASVAPIAETPLGQIQLLHAGQRRLADASTIVRDAMNAYRTAAQNLGFITTDLPQAPGAPGAPPTLSEMLLPTGAADPPTDEPKTGKGGEHDKEGIDLNPSGKDIAVGAEGAIAGGTTDGITKATLDALKKTPGTGPGAADPWLMDWFKDPKIPGFTRVGGLVGVVASVPAVISDVSDGNSVPEAVTREGVGLASGLVAGAAVGGAVGSVVPVAGTAVGVVVGAVVGGAVSFGMSKGVEAAWKPVSNVVGDAVHGVESIFGFG